MAEEYLQITFEKPKEFKTKFGRWWYVKIWFPFWYVWRMKRVANFYGFLWRMFDRKGYEEFKREGVDVHIDTSGIDNEEMREMIINEFKKEYDVTEHHVTHKNLK
jgi:hypothetical protein